MPLEERPLLIGLFEKLTGRYLDGLRQFENRRNLRVTLAGLDATDLGRMDAAALGYLLLRQPELLPGSLEIGAEVAHAGDRRRSARIAP